MQIKRLEECPSYRDVAVYCIMLDEDFCKIKQYASTKNYNKGQIEDTLDAMVFIGSVAPSGVLLEETYIPTFNLDTTSDFSSTMEDLTKDIKNTIDSAHQYKVAEQAPRFCYVLRHILNPNLVGICVTHNQMNNLTYTKHESLIPCES